MSSDQLERRSSAEVCQKHYGQLYFSDLEFSSLRYGARQRAILRDIMVLGQHDDVVGDLEIVLVKVLPTLQLNRLSSHT